MSLGGYGCVKIIQSQPSVDDHCGCPFKHERQEDLRTMLVKRGINGQGVDDVMRLVKQGDYQIACTRVFTLTHGGSEPLMPISHPNKFFDESRKVTAINAAVAAGGAGATVGVKTEVSATQPVPGMWGGGGSVGMEKVEGGSASQPVGVGSGVDGDVAMEEKKEAESMWARDEKDEKEEKEADMQMLD